MTKRKRLLLVGWDSADWKVMRPLMASGHLPGVAHLAKAGVSGDFATLEPQLSPMLWTSIATGKMAYHHGVHGFTEVDSSSAQVVPVSAASRRCKTVWEMLGESGLKSHVVGWFATQGERHPHGCMVSNLFPHLGAVRRDQDPSDWPPPPVGTYWPEELAKDLNELRLAPFEMDADEILRLLVPDLHLIDQNRDSRLWHLAERLAEAYSIHAASTWLLENRPDWDFMAVYFRAIDEICHEFMPYHPPQMAGVSTADFERYRHVVAGAYRLHDLMLLRLIQLAGPDTAVVLVSDHGFHSDHLRPAYTPNVPAGITVWHRRQGALVAAGHGFQAETEIHGAGLLDVTPTILHYFGLPVGRDMEGRVLAESFAEQIPVRFIPSWETTQPAAPNRHSALSSEDSAALLAHFVALGYIDQPAEDTGEAARETRRENKWNLARAMVHTSQYASALPLLEDCFFEFPERHDYGQLLAQAQLKLGLLPEADETISIVMESLAAGELAHLIKARIESEKGNHAAALAQLEAIRSLGPTNPEVLFMLARAYFNNRRWPEAQAMARHALELDPTHSYSHVILARCALRANDPQAAVNAALTAIGYNFGDPRAHFFLGVAYTQLGNWKNAETALLNHLRLRPAYPAGLRYLFHVYRGMGELDKAAACEAVRVTHLKAPAAAPTTSQLEELRQAITQRAADRRAARQRRRLPARADSRTNGEAPASAAREFVIVSGLPRSGTSLMMQMLAAGGLEPMTDHQRLADRDNPEGYYEWEPVKSLPQAPQVIDQAEGKVIKVIASLLPSLPSRHRYKIIYMVRPLEQVAASQLRMLDTAGRQPVSDADQLIRFQQTHQASMLDQVRRNSRCAVIEISYPDLVADPRPTIQRLTNFLGSNRLPDADRMASAVRPELHRNRS